MAQIRRGGRCRRAAGGEPRRSALEPLLRTSRRLPRCFVQLPPVSYRLEAARGVIGHKAGRTTADLTAFAGTEEVRIKGDWRGKGDEAIGSVVASGNRMPIDRKLLTALDARGDNSGEVLASANPSTSGMSSSRISSSNVRSIAPVLRVVS